MCACNSELFIAGAIDSILAQTYGDFEFIIVENGSTDKTWDIITSYADTRIKAFKSDLKQLPLQFEFRFAANQRRIRGKNGCR